jgi:adenylate kinase family enzyme
MAKPRIHIIGGPGSGKSFVAAELSRCLGVPAYDLDDLFLDRSAARRYGVRADAAERDGRLAAIVGQDGWIIEGVYYGWLAPSFDAADTIIELTPSIWVRHLRVIRRFALRKLGRTASKRESLADLWRLLRWSHTYDRRQLAEGREAISARGRQPVACTTLEQVFVATSNFSFQRPAPRVARRRR